MKEMETTNSNYPSYAPEKSGSDQIEEEDLGFFDNEGCVPFSAADIDIYPQQVTVFNIVRRLESGELDLSPDFQRSQDIWNRQQQSRLIESLILGIPIPSFYFTDDREKKEGSIRSKWQVVDGLQRLCSIRNFMVEDATMKLTGLEYLKQFEGMAFNDLPAPYRRNIEETQLTAYLIRSTTPEAVRFNIFKRLNTGGKPLSQQEIRHALNQGVAADFLKRMAEHPLFRETTLGKANPKRMSDREFVNRFLAFRILPLERYADMDSFLNQSLKRFAALDEAARTAIESDFLDSLSVLHETLQEKAFCRFDSVAGKWLPNLNKALFEVFTSVLSQLPHEARMRFRANPFALKEYKNLFLDDSETGLSSVTSISTGRASRVRRRHEIVRVYLQKMSETLP